MKEISKPKTREIIDDFAKDIQERIVRDATPSKEVIFFREEHRTNTEREVVRIPIDYLRYRKDNGRISSDVLSYERDKGPLLERSKEAQTILGEFLAKKDPEKTNELINSIKHSGQREPAIITADGFLINGNRRKVALEKLFDTTRDERYKWMKVVILPGKNDPGTGGPPTLKEIEQIENRYQLQSEGKSEYSRFDKALSIRNKINKGMSLEEQLIDDPNFANLSKKELKKKVKYYKKHFLEPLESIDNYLDALDRQGLYSTISMGITDREGRWEAFHDYNNRLKCKLNDEVKRMKMNIREDEIGDVEEIAFKIIRRRDFPSLSKVHMIMRDLPRMLENKHAKKELFKLLDIDFNLPREECFDENGNEYDPRTKDKIWGTKHASELIHHVKKAKKILDYEKEREKPLDLLEAALNKLQHENMEPSSINLSDLDKAMELARSVKNVASDLETEFYHHKKNLKKLTEKH